MLRIPKRWQNVSELRTDRFDQSTGKVENSIRKGTDMILKALVTGKNRKVANDICEHLENDFFLSSIYLLIHLIFP